MVDRAEFVSKLDEFGVPRALTNEAWTVVQGPAAGVLLYGSWARRDAGPHSDIDLLVLSDLRSARHASEKVSVSFYSSAQLRSAHQTLYGMHLVRDGVILHDNADQLTEILSAFTPPDPHGLLQRVRDLGVILDVTDVDRMRYLSGLTQVARYLLRTATYALALREGDPCFSVEELAVRFHQAELATLLSSHRGVYPQPTTEVLADLTTRLASAVGQLPENPYGSLHNLIVATSVSDSDISHLATFALGIDDDLPYQEIPKVIL